MLDLTIEINDSINQSINQSWIYIAHKRKASKVKCVKWQCYQ